MKHTSLQPIYKLRTPTRFVTLLSLLSLLSLIGCSFARVESAVSPTATTLRVIQTTPVPTVDRSLQPVASHLPEATAAAAEIDCQSTAGQAMAQHTITADVDYAAHQVSVEQQVRYINRGSDTLPELIFDVEPNRTAGAFVLESVAYEDGTAVPAYELTGRRLKVELSEPLQPGCVLEVVLKFQLNVPVVGEGLAGYTGYFGYTHRQLNLGHWLPTLAVRSGGVWIIHETVAIGEQLVSEIADWDITINVANAPEGLLVAAPGNVVEAEAGSWHFNLPAAREFSLSMSPEYRLAEQQTTNGISVEMYSFSDSVVPTEGGPVDGAAFALTAAANSLAMYSDLFGAYPYERFVVVQGDFPDGMEFSHLVFVSGDWFRTFTGNPASYLLLITIHEVAHQWWYARVGSDQATMPWLDEALATYSEFVYLEEYYPDLKDWWWNFRVGSFVQADYNGAKVDSSVYQFTTVREYINAVYLRGAQMLHALRRDLGTDMFFDLLQRYAEAGNGRVMSADVFWSLLSPEALTLTETTRRAYLAVPDVQTARPEATQAVE